MLYSEEKVRNKVKAMLIKLAKIIKELVIKTCFSNP